MYILEYIILQSVLIFWFIYLIKNYPKKDSSNSYNVLFGSIGAIVLMTIIALIHLINEKSLVESITGIN